MLVCNNLTKSFGTNHVLKDVSFCVNDGEIVCLLGNNGAGKTTIINCILKMIKADSGEILLDGKDIRSLKKKVYFSKVNALLESSCNVYDYLSGWQNIEYFAGLMNLDDSFRQRAECYIADFELSGSINEPVGKYSRGMQQKLALIVALISEPELLLLDEPTLGLDIKSKLNVISILNRIVGEQKMSVILTTHQMDVVQKLNSRILLLKDGCVSPFDPAGCEAPLEYDVSYIRDGEVVQVREAGTFDAVYKKYTAFEIVEIRKVEKDIEDVILEALDESR